MSKSAVLHVILIAISLTSRIVFGNRLEKRPPHSFPQGYLVGVTLEPAASTLGGNQVAGYPQVMPVSSAHKSQQGSVATEQASELVANPAPTATIKLPNATSAPHSGSTGCGPCYLFFQVGQVHLCTADN